MIVDRVGRAWMSWVAFWDEREHPRSLGLVRVLLGLCLVYDLGLMGYHGLVDPLYGVAEARGLSDALMRNEIPWVYELLPGTLGSARLLYGLMLGSSITLLLGLFTRTSALVMLITWSQFALVLPYSDRGIDTLLRLVLAVLVFAPTGAWLSLDAWRRTGSLWGSGEAEPAWARKLLIGQLVLMYFSAGMLKTGVTWWPWGHASALYFALQDPAVAAYDFSFARHQPFFFFFTQMGATSTLAYQLTYPLVLWLMWWRRHPERGGRWARFATRYRLEFVWIAVGGFFHLVLATVMNLGIFPWAMLALYPVWLRPDDWRQLWVGARNLVWAAVPHR